MPDTLGGVTTSSDAAAGRLVKCFLDEDQKLFTQQETLFEFEAPEETDPEDPAVKELLEEIDRSLRGFREAAKTHSWCKVPNKQDKNDRTRPAPITTRSGAVARAGGHASASSSATRGAHPTTSASTTSQRR